MVTFKKQTLRRRNLMKLTGFKYPLIAILLPAALWAGTITGTVTNQTLGGAIANALVVIRQGSTTTAIYDSIRTSATGAYTFSGLPAAAYYISVVATGFVTVLNRAASVTATSTVTSDFPMTATLGNLTGVARSGGNPLRGLTVTLRRGSITSTPIATTLTDSTGSYTFLNLTSGTPNYYVTIFNPATSQTATNSNVAITTGATTTSNFILSTTALRGIYATAQPVRWVRAGDRLTLELAASVSARSVLVYGLNGAVQHRVFVPAGESHVVISEAFAPANGYLFQVK